MQSLIQDLRYGVRMLWKKPGFTVAAILSLALGIGATTAIFSIVDAVLLRSLPYPNADRIVQIREVNERGAAIRVAEPNYLDVRERQRSLDAMAQFSGGTVVVTGGKEPIRARTYWVSNEFFDVMGVKPAMGRSFAAEETKPGAGAKVAIVSHSFWQRSLGGRADFSDTTINVDGPAFTVIGVMPPGFSYPQDTDVWVPRETEPVQTSRTAHNWFVIGRIRENVPLTQARADISAIGRQMRQEHGKQVDLVDLAVVPLQEFLTSEARSGLWLMFAAVGLLLLVACANVANLLLAQATLRSSEFALRAALGASRWRMARQFITENMLLAICAGTLGILFSFWGVDVLLSLNQNNLPRVTEIAVNWRALLFTLGLAVAIAVVLGSLPATRFSNSDLQNQLKETGRGASASRLSQHLRQGLIVAQIALTLVLLIVAGLIGRSFLRLMQTDTGFKPENAVVMTLSLPTTIDQQQEQRLQQFHEQLLESLTTMPGVVAAGGINALPLSRRGSNGTFQKDGNPAITGDADFRLASGGYFAAMGIPLLRGRMFDERDRDGAPDACVISQSVAQKYWPGEDPIGRTIQFGNMDGDKDLLHIVGIVGDIRDGGLDQPMEPTVYANSLQRPQWWQVSNQSYVLRTTLPASSVIPAMRSVTESLNQEAFLRFQSLPEIVAASLDTRRFSLVIFGAFAVAALLLAAMGVYGVTSYAVSQRQHEIGIRMALGATAGDVLRLMMSQGMRLALLGVAIGVVTALAIAGTLSKFVYGIATTDPLTFAAISLLLVGVALLACWIPARRATKVDPMIALRCE
jgi:predicted permease